MLYRNIYMTDWGNIYAKSNGGQYCTGDAYVTEIYGTKFPDGTVQGIGIKCSDGKDLGSPYPLEGLQFRINNPYGWRNLPAKIDTTGKLSGVLNEGTGVNNTFVCPPPPPDYPSGPESVMNGMRIGYVMAPEGGRITGFGMSCVLSNESICTRNIDDPRCTNASQQVLNNSCSLNMSQHTCTRRRQELYPDIVENYCKDNLADPLCECYKEAPSYIPVGIYGLPQCWNQKCAQKGYIPGANTECKNITICTQDLQSGAENVFTDNILVQNCNTLSTNTPDANTSSTNIPVWQNPPVFISNYINSNNCIL